MDPIDTLAGVTLFENLDRELRQQLIHAAEPRRYRRGDLVYAEGGGGEELLLLLSGSVMLFRGAPTAQRAAITVKCPPDVLGEEALADGLPRIASVEALQEAFALALPGSELRDMVQHNPDFGGAARQWLVRQVERLVQLRADDLLLDLAARVARTLVQLTSDGTAGAAVTLSQATLAGLTRSSRQSVNRVVRDFARRGWLRVEAGSAIVVSDLEALRRRAGLARRRTGTRFVG